LPRHLMVQIHSIAGSVSDATIRGRPVPASLRVNLKIEFIALGPIVSAMSGDLKSSALDIVIADEHPMFRDGLALLMGEALARPRILHAGDQRELGLRLTELTGGALVILSAALPGAPLPVLLGRLGRQEPRVSIILLVEGVMPAGAVRKALREGVQGLIQRDSSRDLVRLAVQLVLAGGVYLPPDVLARMLEVQGLPTSGAAGKARPQVQPQPKPQPQAPRPASSEASAALQGFSPRELQVLACLAAGLSNRAIADSLRLELATVKTHVHSVMGKLAVKNRTQAALKALEMGVGPIQAA